MLYSKGCTIIAEPRLAHIMPEHFHQPELFEPERFLPPRNEGKMYEFIPFGGGVHACLGAQMAMIITKIFASHLIYLFDWQLTGLETTQKPLVATGGSSQKKKSNWGKLFSLGTLAWK